jgi:uncharacterized membrane protein
MRFEISVPARARTPAVWAVFTDVRSWPRWTSSVRTIDYRDDETLRPGTRVRIAQPRMPKLVWQVTEVEEGRSFTWVASSPGVRTVARHAVDADPEGGSRLTLTLEQEGPLAGLVGLLMGRQTRRYVRTEAAGLAAAAEERDIGSPG